MIGLLAGLGGLALGGALNAAAIRWDERLPARYPPTYCIHGGHPLRRLRGLPALGYALTRGRCPACGRKVALVYPFGEAALALSWALAGLQLGPSRELAAALLLIALLYVIVQTDLSALVIPDAVVAAGIAGALLMRLWSHPLPLWNYGAAALAGSGLLLAIGVLCSLLLRKEALGGGDVKLYVPLGLLLGLELTLLSLLLASVAGLAGALILRLSGRDARQLPFGPAIAAGALCAYWWGAQWVDAYLRLLQPV
ncbi:prepilin peptidase [Paenibacillus sabuli]|nr:A24 family peptidase [Paenibacillus sabuli]